MRAQSITSLVSTGQWALPIPLSSCIYGAMMFCINDNYTIPLHTLLTSIIDGQGGSATLIKVLNQLGICSSLDTLSRQMQQMHTNRESTLSHFLDNDCFTVVSADNIDFKHSYARVCKGEQSSSWHGTSIQIVQPRPSLSLQEPSPAELSPPTSLPENSAGPKPILGQKRVVATSTATPASKRKQATPPHGPPSVCQPGTLPTGATPPHGPPSLLPERSHIPNHTDAPAPETAPQGPPVKMLQKPRTGTEYDSQPKNMEEPTFSHMYSHISQEHHSQIFC